MVKQLVLLGGGHAHVQTLDQLDSFVKKGYGVTVVQPSPYHYYSGMGPGMLGGTYSSQQIRFVTGKIVESAGGRFVIDRARLIDPEKQLVYLEKSEAPIPYDVLSCNVGSFVPTSSFDTLNPHLYPVKPIENLRHAHEDIQRKIREGDLRILIAGGGPSAAEIAGNVHQLCRDEKFNTRIMLFAGRKFFGHKPGKVRAKAKAILLNKGIEIVEGPRVGHVENNIITLESGKSHAADIIFWAVGVKPSPLFTDSDMATGKSGGLPVNQYLQSPEYGNIFGGGDCVDFIPGELEKVGVFAVRQNPILRNNLMAALEGKAMKPFDPGGDYLLIYNLGSGDGLLSKWSATLTGTSAFRIKSYIDRKFMRTYKKPYG